MFQHVEQEHEVVVTVALEPFPQGPDADPRPPARVAEERRVGLESFDLAEFLQTFEEQAIPAASIEDPPPRAATVEAADPANHERLARAPPPVAFPERPIRS